MLANWFDSLQHHPAASFAIGFVICGLFWSLVGWVKSWTYKGHFRWDIKNRRRA